MNEWYIVLNGISWVVYGSRATALKTVYTMANIRRVKIRYVTITKLHTSYDD